MIVVQCIRTVHVGMRILDSLCLHRHAMVLGSYAFVGTTVGLLSALFNTQISVFVGRTSYPY